jgi:oxygen-independent coproporphyrinogen-3 oxidase
MVRRYLAALELDLARLREPIEVDTLFLGGGTPTHLEAQDLHRLMELLQRWFQLAPGAEFSVEANPLDLLDEARTEVLRVAGVNRISIGAQSFQADELRLLSRDHQGTDVCEAVARIQNWI